MKDGKHRKEILANLRALKEEELSAQERDLTEQLFWLRFKQRGGRLEDTASVKNMRRALVRIKTIGSRRRAKAPEGGTP